MTTDDHKDAEINTYDGESDRPTYGSLWDDGHYEHLIELGPRSSFESALHSVTPGATVLFLGVGGGTNVATLTKKFPDASVHGIELSADRVRQTNVDYGDVLRLARADAEYLPFDDDSFDVVVAHAVLHHLPDWRGRGLDEIVRILGSEGSFVFYEPGRYNPSAALRRRFAPSNIHTPGQEPFDPRELHTELSGRFSDVEMTGHCLFSHTFPVLDNYLPIPVPFGVTRRLYAAERTLFERAGPLLAWILTGRADLWIVFGGSDHQFQTEAQREPNVDARQRQQHTREISG
mgnify:CR=1 FL=1